MVKFTIQMIGTFDSDTVVFSMDYCSQFSAVSYTNMTLPTI